MEREKLVELLDIIIQPGQKTLGDVVQNYPLDATAKSTKRRMIMSKKLPGCANMTNAQKIRSMSDEELVGLIRVIYMSEECPFGTLECETCFFEEVCAGIYCGKEIEWLKQPAEGE